jgi:hypothetical protein
MRWSTDWVAGWGADWVCVTNLLCQRAPGVPSAIRLAGGRLRAGSG